jgi:hypothetical protein
MAHITDLERRLQTLPPIPAGATVLPAVMSRVHMAGSGSGLAGGWIGEVVRSIGLAAGVAICVMAYYTRAENGQWLTQMFSLHTQPAGLTNGILRQSPSFLMLCGIGAVLAAAAILWQGSEEPHKPAAIG